LLLTWSAFNLQQKRALFTFTTMLTNSGVHSTIHQLDPRISFFGWSSWSTNL